MKVSKHHIAVSDEWLDDLDRISGQQATLPLNEAINLIAHVRALRKERDELIAEIEAFERGLPAPTIPNDVQRRQAWAKLGWIV